MPRSVYYYWCKKPVNGLYQEVKALILQIYHQHQGRYGYRRILLALRNLGIHLNHKTVQKLMGQLGIKSTVRPKKYKSYRGDMGKIATNELSRSFEANQPHQKWVTDVTEFNICGEKIYLSPILDLYNREIISYEVSERPQLSMVMTMLRKALMKLKPQDKPLLHSDQGWQYQMGSYQKILQEKGLRQSMSRRGNCLDNAVMENFFGILKTEFFYGKKFESKESFKERLDQYIHYYNHERIKQKLKGLSPVQYRNQSFHLAT